MARIEIGSDETLREERLHLVVGRTIITDRLLLAALLLQREPITRVTCQRLNARTRSSDAGIGQVFESADGNGRKTRITFGPRRESRGFMESKPELSLDVDAFSSREPAIAGRKPAMAGIHFARETLSHFELRYTSVTFPVASS